MKKKLFALSGVFLIALVIAGLWAAKAVNFNGAQNTREPIRYPLLRDVNGANDAGGIGDCPWQIRRHPKQWVGRSLVTQATISVEEALKGDAATGTS